MIIHHGIPPAQPAGSWVGIDSELFTKKGDKNHLHRPHTGRFACVTIATDDENVYFIDREQDVQPALDAVRGCVWVMQNAKFDITHFRRWAKVPPRKKLFDTMWIEKILFNGYYDGFSLQDLSRRYLLTKMDKDVRDEFEEADGFTPERIEYACLDPLVTRKVALAQKKLMTPQDRYIWSDIELPALWAFLDFKGFGIDTQRWIALAERNQQRQEEIDAVLPFNPRSSTQVKAWMLANGFKKLESSDEEHLTEAVEKWPNTKAAEVAQLVLQSRGYGKNASTYGFSFVSEFLEQDDGIDTIYANYFLIGAETGRTSCRNPNMQNIPARETKEYRECFIARPDHTLIIGDFGAQEPRLVAYASGDEYLIRCFQEGRDPYISMAKDAFEEEITKKSPRRPIYKDVVLGLAYGLSKYGLARKFGISKDEAQTLINKAAKLLSGVYAWGNKQAQEQSFVTTPFGRKCWLNPYSSQRERNARNSPIQGGAADMMKRCLGKMHQDWPFPFPFCCVGMIHDEVVFDFPDTHAKEGYEFVQTYMEEESTKMVNGQIRFIAELYAGKTWAEK